MIALPKDFLWGTATSSHQVEGDNTGNDWWDWEQVPGRIYDASTSGRAAEWWAGRAEEDLARAAALGQNAHRLSIEWSRLEPEEGRFDTAALARYRAILDAAKEHDLAVMLTLHHFTLPRWVAQLGGWTAREVPALFARFAEWAADGLGDRVALWVTLNEPAVLAYMGYAGKRWPPGRGSLPAAFRALRRLLDAHARAYRAIHRALPAARVGLALNLPLFAPASRRPLDRAAARAQDWAFNGAFLRALSGGTLHPPLSVLPCAVPGLAGSFDWLGLNFYGRYDVRFDPTAGATLFGRHVQQPTVATDTNDWGQPSPDGRVQQLGRLAALGVPVYVTENGLYDPADRRRGPFLIEHVDALQRARARGVDVRGYFHWSLVDNFEWAEGWSATFGLLALDRQTQARTARPSAAIYEAICRHGGDTREAEALLAARGG
ncbi:MAG: glycoside hydrolase family 1 protein [Sandaracinaceae bacterium]